MLAWERPPRENVLLEMLEMPERERVKNVAPRHLALVPVWAFVQILVA